MPSTFYCSIFIDGAIWLCSLYLFGLRLCMFCKNDCARKSLNIHTLLPDMFLSRYVPINQLWSLARIVYSLYKLSFIIHSNISLNFLWNTTSSKWVQYTIMHITIAREPFWITIARVFRIRLRVEIFEYHCNVARYVLKYEPTIRLDHPLVSSTRTD